MYYYESENWKRLRDEVRPHTTGYCLREHTAVDPANERGYHLEIWTNKYTVFPIMLTAWQQPSGDWLCQVWNGTTIDFEAMKEKYLRQQAEALEKEIEGMDKDVEYLQRHGSGKAHAEAKHKRHRAHQKLTDIYKQLTKE